MPSGKVVPHTAAEMFADPDGYDEYDPPPKKARRDLTLYPHCSQHPRYHGLLPPYRRVSDPWDSGICQECQNIYKQVQEKKKRS
jgi:hypothetical protein